MKDNDSINRAFRSNEISRWQSQDFILGYEIKRSNNLDKSCEICERLAGKYPKNFIWSGWHDKCKCFITPILQDYEKLRENRRNRFHAALHGEEFTQAEPKGVIEFLPRQFIDWCKQNIQQMNESGTYPDFFRDNIKMIKDNSCIY